MSASRPSVAAPCDQPAELTDYGHEDVPLGPKLSSFALHSLEWRTAFLTRLAEVGYIGLFEASARVYDLLNAPRHFRCALVGQLAHVPGTGKQAIFNALTTFLDEYLSMPPPPPPSRFDGLEAWHSHVIGGWQAERHREEQVVIKFASILDGHHPGNLL